MNSVISSDQRGPDWRRGLIWGALVSALGAFAWLMPRVRRECRDEGHLLKPTVSAVYAAYGLHFAAFLLVVARRHQRTRPALSRLGWPLAAGA